MTLPLPPAWMRILAVALAAVAGLIVLVFYQETMRRQGTEVAMTMDPLDPQALLSGHYVKIALNEALPAGQACPPGVPQGDQTASQALHPGSRWVALSPHAGHYSVSGTGVSRAEAAKYGPVVAVGDAYCQVMNGAPPTVIADLGVSQVSLSQPEAQRISSLSATTLTHQGGDVLVLLSIGQDGQARPKGLLVGAQRVEPTWY